MIHMVGVTYYYTAVVTLTLLRLILSLDVGYRMLAFRSELTCSAPPANHPDQVRVGIFVRPHILGLLLFMGGSPLPCALRCDLWISQVPIASNAIAAIFTLRTKPILSKLACTKVFCCRWLGLTALRTGHAKAIGVPFRSSLY